MTFADVATDEWVQRLGVEAADENRAYIKFLIPRSEEAKLRVIFGSSPPTFSISIP